MNYSSSCFSKLNYGADLAVTTDFGLENCQASQAFSAQAGVFQWHGNFAEYVLYIYIINDIYV